ncbi:MAG TPA: FAD-dependent oxidoreductase [Bryobacteraceae bacterium]|nr:FAD-dependent oxidoreductase [Bryobacteraceae bacterium]HPT25514.1 FAD-dependent oxidoreductase [Bryobacteraceae bacterium]
MVSRRSLLRSPAALAAGGAKAQASNYRLVRDIPVEQGYDLVVAGGGPAGTAAAVCAARLGAKVLLVEATGCLGGMGTSGLVTAFDPMANGERMLVGGFMREIVETLNTRGFLPPGLSADSWRKKFMTWTPFNVEGYKLLLDELTTQAGVEVRFFTRVIDADSIAGAGTLNGVVLHNIEGYRFVRAKTFVDGTGDAVLAKLCGVRCREAGRDTPHIMPATLTSLFAGIDWERFPRGKQYDLLALALKDNHFTQPDKHLPGMSRIGQTTGYLNGGHMFNLDALRCKSLTDGIMLGRRIAQEYMSFYRKYAPGCEKIEHVTTAPLVGVRESRRILGEYELNFDDYLGRRQFPDQIAVFNKSVDIHPYDTSDTEWERFSKEYKQTGALKSGECFGIPYGVLVPKGWKNLWVAGRPVSADVKVHGSLRVQPAASMMGQAAGTAALQSIRTGRPARDIDTEQLVLTLRKAGAYLPQVQTRKTLSHA